MSFDFLKDKHMKVHFIGIGGISMSGLAAVLLNGGYRVSGSDAKASKITESLKSKGAEVYIGHNSDNIKDADLVVYTAAIPKDNPELLESISRNIPLMDRAEFLGHIMNGHKYNVAVAGTHGKTTTTSMISHITLEGNLDPTILVGGELDIINGNYKVGNSEYFITEACEYKESFLSFYPYIGIILNIDADHLDYYRDINHIQETFEKFIDIIPKDGYIIGNADDERVKKAMSKAECNVIGYGIDNGDILAKNISYDNKGCGTFDVYKNGTKLFTLSLSVPGRHNVLNALSTVAVGLIFNLSDDAIINGLKAFGGAHKRFEYKGVKDGVTVIDDYAHHPVEIQATLSTAAKIPHNKTYCVFQPHTYTRTKTLFKEFTECFDHADEVILMDIYAAREKDLGEISSKILGDALREKGIKCINVSSHKEALDYVKTIVKDKDLLLTVGAGDVVQVGEMFLNE